MEGDEIPPPDSEIINSTTNDDAEKEKLRIRKANDMAYNALIQSMDMPMAFQRVKNAVTTELPNGHANKAWKSLLSKFEPDNLTSATLLEKKFTEIYLDNIEHDL